MLLINIEELAAKNNLTYVDMQKALEALYKLEYNPVAIKFFFNQDEFDAFIPEKVPSTKMTFCQATLASRMDNYIVKVTDDKLLCGNARTVFGFREASDAEVDEQVKYTIDWDLAKECMQARPSLPVDELKGIMTAPLYKTPVDPDVVFFVVNVFQAYHILNDYIGGCKAPTITSHHTINSVVCGGSVRCFQDNTPEMKTMCAGSFTSGKTEKGEVNVFIPGKHIGQLASQLIKRTVKYGGSSFLGAGGQDFPGIDVCKKCPMIRFKDYKAE